MPLDELLRRETISVLLSPEDQMQLRRLMEDDVHEPGDMSASEAKGCVVENSVQWVFTTLLRLSDTLGALVLHFHDEHEEPVDWFGMLQEAANDTGDLQETDLSISARMGMQFMDILCENLQNILEQPVTRDVAIRFAIRWRHFSVQTWLRHQNGGPELGIRFSPKGRRSKFVAIAI